MAPMRWHMATFNTMTNQAYGEWKPDYDGQMEFRTVAYRAYLADLHFQMRLVRRMEKHGLTEFGKLYCVNVDNAVYQGFRSDFVCTQPPLPWPGRGTLRIRLGLSAFSEEVSALAERKNWELPV